MTVLDITTPGFSGNGVPVPSCSFSQQHCWVKQLSVKVYKCNMARQEYTNIKMMIKHSTTSYSQYLSSDVDNKFTRVGFQTWWEYSGRSRAAMLGGPVWTAFLLVLCCCLSIRCCPSWCSTTTLSSTMACTSTTARRHSCGSMYWRFTSFGFFCFYNRFFLFCWVRF